MKLWSVWANHDLLGVFTSKENAIAFKQKWENRDWNKETAYVFEFEADTELDEKRVP